MLYYHCFMEKGYFFARAVKGEDVPFEHEGVKLIVIEDTVVEEQIPMVLRSTFLSL